MTTYDLSQLPPEPTRRELERDRQLESLSGIEAAIVAKASEMMAEEYGETQDGGFNTVADAVDWVYGHRAGIAKSVARQSGALEAVAEIVDDLVTRELLREIGNEQNGRGK